MSFRDLVISKSFLPKWRYRKEYYKILDIEKTQYLLICNDLYTRRIARDYAISFAVDYIVHHNINYPVQYWNKALLIDRFNNKEYERVADIGFLIFEGIDEAVTQREMDLISTFITPFIMDEQPLILISSKLDDSYFHQFRAYTFGTQLLDLNEVILDEALQSRS